jgi:hypothetical protein
MVGMPPAYRCRGAGSEPTCVVHVVRRSITAAPCGRSRRSRLSRAKAQNVALIAVDRLEAAVATMQGFVYGKGATPLPPDPDEWTSAEQKYIDVADDFIRAVALELGA